MVLRDDEKRKSRSTWSWEKVTLLFPRNQYIVCRFANRPPSQDGITGYIKLSVYQEQIGSSGKALISHWFDGGNNSLFIFFLTKTTESSQSPEGKVLSCQHWTKVQLFRNSPPKASSPLPTMAGNRILCLKWMNVIIMFSDKCDYESNFSLLFEMKTHWTWLRVEILFI